MVNQAFVPNTIEFNSLQYYEFIKNTLPTLDSSIQAPTMQSHIIKDECIYSCDSPESPFGLFINLTTFQAVGVDFIQIDIARTGNSVYLQYKQTYFLKESSHTDNNNLLNNKTPTKLGIDIEDGFSSDTSHLIRYCSYSLYFPNIPLLFPLHSPDQLISIGQIPEIEYLGFSYHLFKAIEALITHSTASCGGMVSVPWEETIQESIYAENLKQVENPPVIPPSNWRCTECGNTKNLWLHLSDGYIGCGRKIFGVSESGCLNGEEGAAVRHYENNKDLCPLAVKLGTLTLTSSDVYSYPEDAMVIDPKLPEHLLHLGINIYQLKKTEKTLLEMQLEYNKNYNWQRICEGGHDLNLLHGPGHIGLINFGNSCYMNVIFQLLARIPVLKQLFSPTRILSELLSSFQNNYDPANDLILQLGKVFDGLLTDRYYHQRLSILEDMSPELQTFYLSEHPNEVIYPGLLRYVVSKGHTEFSSSRQQDAEEFLRYVLEKLISFIPKHFALKEHDYLIQELFTFEVEEQLRSSQDLNRVKLTTISEMILSLPIHVEDQSRLNNSNTSVLVNHNLETDDTTNIQQRFYNLFQQWMSGESIDLNVTVDSAKKTVKGQKTRKIKTYPRYLLVQLRRFFLGKDWTAQKIEDSIIMPEMLDLTNDRAVGLGPNDILWEDSTHPYTTDIDNQHSLLISQIEAMGFSRYAGIRAIKQLGEVPIELYIEWIVGHLDDPLLNTPLDNETITKDLNKYTSDMLESMGFTLTEIRAALIENNNNEEKAIEWLMIQRSNLTESDLEQIISNFISQPNSPVITQRFGSIDHGKYRLVGLASHMGSNANSGHYVCHIKDNANQLHQDSPPSVNENQKWILFNDKKVAESKSPPLDLGYLYVYERLDDVSFHI